LWEEAATVVAAAAAELVVGLANRGFGTVMAALAGL